MDEQTSVDTHKMPENLVEEMALAAERLWRLLEQRRSLVATCKTIPQSLTRLIRDANDHYFRLQKLAEQSN